MSWTFQIIHIVEVFTYKFGFRLGNFPNNGILLVVTSRKDLVAFEAEARACYLSTATDRVIIFLLHFFKIIVRNMNDHAKYSKLKHKQKGQTFLIALLFELESNFFVMNNKL